uniref:Uncharacterized protein n=1 Tax=Arundo donax TaxID=35708 RepID=A0A0A9BMZ7_ARUDO
MIRTKLHVAVKVKRWLANWRSTTMMNRHRDVVYVVLRRCLLDGLSSRG